MNEEQNLLQQSEPDPNEKELRALWREVGKDMVKGSVKTLDEVGKQLIAVDGVLSACISMRSPSATCAPPPCKGDRCGCTCCRWSSCCSACLPP